MGKAIVIGGGIIGLSSAFYLQRSGWDVTVLDKGDFNNNCSYGNAGYICPSHFIPLATPGIVKKGLRWMLNARSPFYIQPRINGALIDWGIKFMRSAKPEKVVQAAVPLRDIALISQQEYESWSRMPGFDFAYEHKGLLEIFQTEAGRDHAAHTVHQALELGLEGTRLLDAAEMQALEPHTKINGLGAILFACDAHCYPNKLMQNLGAWLKNNGVVFKAGEEALDFEAEGGKISAVITGNNRFEADAIVMATGSWSRSLAAKLQVNIPLVAGRGYSVTLENSPYRVNYPAILYEGRVAITPMNGNKIRFGGTMEITSTHAAPRMARVQGILDAVKRFYPEFDIPMPSPEKIWYGFRPCSADGLPYIGRPEKWKNLVVATGHAMLGLSLGAGTGKLVGEIVNGDNSSMNMQPFRVERFQ